MEKIHFPGYPNPHSFLAVTCLVYYSDTSASYTSRSQTPQSPDSWEDPPGKAEVNDEEQQQPLEPGAEQFLDYATTYWHQHTAKAAMAGHSTHPYIVAFLANYKGSLLSWCCRDHRGSPLGLAAHLKLLDAISSGELPYSSEDARLFHWVAINGDPRTLSALLSRYGLRGNDRGEIPFHSIISSGWLAPVEEFLSMATKSFPTCSAHDQGEYDLAHLINLPHSSGSTPLMVACSTVNFTSWRRGRGDVETAEGPLAVLDLLLRYGSDVHARDHEGMTAFLKTVLDLKEYRSPFYGPAQTPYDVIRRLVDFDPSIIDHRDARGRTALMLLVAPPLYRPLPPRDDEPDSTIARVASFFDIVGHAAKPSFTNPKDDGGTNVLVYASWNAEVVEWLCENVDLSAITIKDALLHAFQPAALPIPPYQEVIPPPPADVVKSLLTHASKPGRDLFKEGWDDPFAIVLLAHAFSDPCERLLTLLLICISLGHEAIRQCIWCNLPCAHCRARELRVHFPPARSYSLSSLYSNSNSPAHSLGGWLPSPPLSPLLATPARSPLGSPLGPLSGPLLVIYTSRTPSPEPLAALEEPEGIQQEEAPTLDSSVGSPSALVEEWF